MNEIDTGKILTELIKGISKPILTSIYKSGSEQYNKALVSFELCFKSYVQRTYDKSSKIKTLLYRDKPVDLKKHYVDASFIVNRKKITEKKIH